MKKKTVKNSKKKVVPADEFRHNIKAKHPAYIFEKHGKIFYNIPITHAKKTHGRVNEPLEKSPNPKPQTNKPNFAVTKIRKDQKKNFTKRLTGWKFTENDKKKIERIKKGNN
jgi:hypothetical protein